MKVTAKLDNLRIAPRKSKLVADMIKGLDVREALTQLDVRVKRSCLPVKKLLQSAMANGENNFGIDKENMYVADVIVGAGPTLKRWMPKAFGRAGQIMKRTSKITIIIDERVEGKNRKSKEQLEKEREARMKEIRKAEEAAKKKAEAEEKDNKDKDKKTDKPGKAKDIREKDDTLRDGQSKGWKSKIFRRKSM